MEGQGQPRIGKDKVQLLRQALNTASSSLKLANQLLNEIEQMGGAASVPGLEGKYDGRFMVTEAGKKYPVPDNYSAKTQLVYGDKLKMIEGPMGRQFKLLEKVNRVEEDAQLAVKDGQFAALGKSGSYELLQGAVRYWGGKEGDKIKILLPEGNKTAPFACLVEIIGRKPGDGLIEERRAEKPKTEEKPAEKPVKEEPKEEKVEEKKAPKEEKKEVAPAKKAAPKPATKKAAPKKEEAKPTKEEKKEEEPAPKEEKLNDEELR